VKRNICWTRLYRLKAVISLEIIFSKMEKIPDIRIGLKNLGCVSQLLNVHEVSNVRLTQILLYAAEFSVPEPIIFMFKILLNVHDVRSCQLLLKFRYS
jgi:hypothetical protein